MFLPGVIREAVFSLTNIEKEILASLGLLAQCLFLAFIAVFPKVYSLEHIPQDVIRYYLFKRLCCHINLGNAELNNI